MPLHYWQAAILFSKCINTHPSPGWTWNILKQRWLHITQSAQSQQSYGLWTVLPLTNCVVSLIEEVPKYQNVPVCHFHALLNQLCSEKTWFGLRVSHLVSLHGIMNKKGQKSPTNKLMLIMVEVTDAIMQYFILLYYYMRNFCNLIGLEQRYFSLIWNTYMWKLQPFAGSSINKK